MIAAMDAVHANPRTMKISFSVAGIALFAISGARTWNALALWVFCLKSRELLLRQKWYTWWRRLRGPWKQGRRDQWKDMSPWRRACSRERFRLESSRRARHYQSRRSAEKLENRRMVLVLFVLTLFSWRPAQATLTASKILCRNNGQKYA